MDVSRNGCEIAFRTPFSPQHDLVQVLTGAAQGDPTRNNPVDFKMAGLQRKGHPDIWHADHVLAFSTDECSPVVINGDDIGGNHGHGCALRVQAPSHGLTCRDIGLVWLDDDGTEWTLLRVENPHSLLFLSPNIGPSKYDYHFLGRYAGALRRNGVALNAVSQQGGVQLTPAIRHTQRDCLCLQNGQWVYAGGWMPDCDAAEIREVYEVVNPATVAQAIREQRPENGYSSQPSLAVGETMLIHRMTYRIEADGTILCDFDHQLTQPVHMRHYLGIMHQEKSDVFGGGVWRVIPKLKPFDGFDFTVPYNTTRGPMPNWFTLTPEYWQERLSPPDNQVDFIRRPDGSCAAAFASGFLPVHDGHPSVRAHTITDAGDVVPSCKTYPTFAGGRALENRLGDMRGTAYKKYYLPEHDDAAVFTAANMLYVYLLKDGSVTVSESRAATVLESFGATWQAMPGGLCVSGQKGAYIAFELA